MHNADASFGVFALFSPVLRQEYVVRRAELVKDAKDRAPPFQLYDVQPSAASLRQTADAHLC